MSNTSQTPNVIKKSVHAHKILELMAGSSGAPQPHYTTETLTKTLHNQFGVDATYNTCSEKGLVAEEIIEALRLKGKFKPAQEAGDNAFTLNSSCSCKHN